MVHVDELLSQSQGTGPEPAYVAKKLLKGKKAASVPFFSKSPKPKCKPATHFGRHALDIGQLRLESIKQEASQISLQVVRGAFQEDELVVMHSAALRERQRDGQLATVRELDLARVEADEAPAVQVLEEVQLI